MKHVDVGTKKKIHISYVCALCNVLRSNKNQQGPLFSLGGAYQTKQEL
jgi:hypothetical protein